MSGVAGSPLIIIEELRSQHQLLRTKHLTLTVHLNEYDTAKQAELVKLVDGFKGQVPYGIDVTNLDFDEAFNNALPRLTSGQRAKLLFMDQNGLKHVTEARFLQLINFSFTDFIFFVSSSFLYRFPDHPALLQYLHMTSADLKSVPYSQLHRQVMEYYRSLIPPGQAYYLGSYSIKKGSNIYGLIFGSGSPKGLEKFLRTSWKNSETGDANYDIDDDNITDQLELLTGKIKSPKRLDRFRQQLRDSILQEQLKTNRDVYLYTLQGGFTPSHALEVLREMMKEGLVVRVAPKLNYDSCRLNAVLVPFKLL